MKEVAFDFHEKNFIVIGASSGIGRQVALELAEAGAHVLAVARNQDRLNAIREQYPTLIDTAVVDVVAATRDDWSSVLNKITNQYGKLDGTIYTAGTTATTPLRFYDEIAAQNIMDTGFWGAMKLLQICTKKKYAKQNASHVVFSSVAAYEGTKGILFYAATKAAVQTAVKVIAKEISEYGQRINSISPGWIETEMTRSYLDSVGMNEKEILVGPLGMGTSQNVSGMVLFLLSDRSSWITGRDFIIDGGYLNGIHKNV